MVMISATTMRIRENRAAAVVPARASYVAASAATINNTIVRKHGTDGAYAAVQQPAVQSGARVPAGERDTQEG